MVKFATAVLRAQRHIEAERSRLWLGRLDRALERRGIDPDRRERWTKALGPFLALHALEPEVLRPGQVQAFIEEQAESGRYQARALIDLIQALSFFYDSVVEQRELAGEAGHPFDLPAEDWAVSETIIALDRGRSGSGATGNWARIRVF
jgi:hypothetical protein